MPNESGSPWVLGFRDTVPWVSGLRDMVLKLSVRARYIRLFQDKAYSA
jgi:hypothetical protein